MMAETKETLWWVAGTLILSLSAMGYFAYKVVQHEERFCAECDRYANDPVDKLPVKCFPCYPSVRR